MFVLNIVYFFLGIQRVLWFVFSTFLALFFLVFRCSIFKVRFPSALADSLYSISYLFPFVKSFLLFSSKIFRHFLAQYTFSSCPSLAELLYNNTKCFVCQGFFSYFFNFFQFFPSLYIYPHFNLSLKEIIIFFSVLDTLT